MSILYIGGTFALRRDLRRMRREYNRFLRGPVNYVDPVPQNPEWFAKWELQRARERVEQKGKQK